MWLQQCRVLRVDPRGLVRGGEQDVSGTGLADREQSLEKSRAIALGRRRESAFGVARPGRRAQALARDDIDVDAPRTETAHCCNRTPGTCGCQNDGKPLTHDATLLRLCRSVDNGLNSRRSCLKYGSMKRSSAAA